MRAPTKATTVSTKTMNRTHTQPESSGAGFRSRHRNTAGFSLIEILVVTTLISLISTLTISTFVGGADVNKDAWEMSGLIERARAYAMAQNTYVWVGFNMTDVSTVNQLNTAVFVVASRDGSSNSATDNLIQINKPEILKNVTLSDSLPGYGSRPTVKVAQLTTQTPPSPAISLPGGFAQRFQSDNNRVIEIHPDGSISLPVDNPPPGLQWVEIGLQPTQGVAKTSKNTAALQVGCLTGQVRVFRP